MKNKQEVGDVNRRVAWWRSRKKLNPCLLRLCLYQRKL